jgi:hypothetical protein
VVPVLEVPPPVELPLVVPDDEPLPPDEEL